LFVAKNRRKSFDFKQIRSKKLVFIRCFIAVFSGCFRLKIRRFVHPETTSLKKNSIKFADSIFLTTFDFRSLILSRKRSGLVGNVASVGLQRLDCNLSVQRRLCRSASFFFFQGDLTCTGDGNPAQKIAKSFSISSSFGLAVLPFSPARGTLCQRGNFYHFWVQRKRKK
jgi:hypothetical protein